MSEKYWNTDWSDEKEAEFRAEWDIRIADCPRSACRRSKTCRGRPHCVGMAKHPISDEVVSIKRAQLHRALMAERLRRLAILEAEEEAKEPATKQTRPRWQQTG